MKIVRFIKLDLSRVPFFFCFFFYLILNRTFVLNCA